MSRLSFTDVLALGFMTFALFLGAGNIIFPPQVGQNAGEAYWPAALGFLVTGVGLPVLGIVAVAVVGGGLDRIVAPLPRIAAVLFGLAIYLSIGPMFALPRTATVAFEIGVVPFIPLTHSLGLMLFTAVFFAVATTLALIPGRLVDVIGKWITPALIALLLIIAAATVLDPQGPLGPTSTSWQDAPFSRGFQQGYLTMDTLASMVFGILIVTAVKARGISDKAALTRYTLYAGLIAGFCLACVYLPLTYMGATSHGVAPQAGEGQLIRQYVYALFGTTDPVLLGIVIVLACLTTAVGLLTSCGEYFHRLLPKLPYRATVVTLGIVSAVIANQGLTALIQISVPVLVALYPLAIVLIALSFLRGFMRAPRPVFCWTMGLTLLVSLLDGLAATGIAAVSIPATTIKTWLPLGMQDAGWIVPALLGLTIGWLTQPREATGVNDLS